MPIKNKVSEEGVFFYNTNKHSVVPGFQMKIDILRLEVVLMGWLHCRKGGWERIEEKSKKTKNKVFFESYVETKVSSVNVSAICNLAYNL